MQLVDDARHGIAAIIAQEHEASVDRWAGIGM